MANNRYDGILRRAAYHWPLASVSVTRFNFLIIGFLLTVISCPGQTMNKAFSPRGALIDNIITSAVIVFDKRSNYTKYTWRRPLNGQGNVGIYESGSYTMSNDTIFCIPLDTNSMRYRYILMLDNEDRASLISPSEITDSTGNAFGYVLGLSIPELDAQSLKSFRNASK